MEWLKNDEPLRVAIPHKYEVIGNGTQLRVRNIGFADTGAYMCQAGSVGGMARDISSLVVQENPLHSQFEDQCVTRYIFSYTSYPERLWSVLEITWNNILSGKYIDSIYLFILNPITVFFTTQLISSSHTLALCRRGRAEHQVPRVSRHGPGSLWARHVPSAARHTRHWRHTRHSGVRLRWQR